MTGLIYLMLGCLYFICIGIDIAIFFVEIRLILLWKNISCLVPFDQAGKPLINALTRQASRLLKTKRSFYPLELQQKCIDIRKTGIGLNGQATIFYASRKNKLQKSPSQLDHQYEELADILSQMGLNVTCNKVRQAVKALYPAGLAQCPDEGMVIRDLFRYFKQWL